MARLINSGGNDLYSRILFMIRTCSTSSERMPPEEILAAKLGISRVKLRDILAVLETQGYVNRKKGVGTLINRCALNETVRLDIDVIYEEIVAQAGYQPKTLVRKLQHLKYTPEAVAKRLEITPEQSTWAVEKIVYANDVPAIYLNDFILPQYYNQSDIDMQLLAKSTFSFVQQYVQKKLESIVVHVDARIADQNVAQALQLNEGSPILRLESMCYDFYSHPVLCSIEYHNTKILPYSFFKRMYRTNYYTSE